MYMRKSSTVTIYYRVYVLHIQDYANKSIEIHIFNLNTCIIMTNNFTQKVLKYASLLNWNNLVIYTLDQKYLL